MLGGCAIAQPVPVVVDSALPPGEAYVLEAHGTWLDVAPYGPVWYPRVDAGWAPYWYDDPWAFTYGTGMWVRAGFGWAWAPHHRGRRPGRYHHRRRHEFAGHPRRRRGAPEYRHRHAGRRGHERRRRQVGQHDGDARNGRRGDRDDRTRGGAGDSGVRGDRGGRTGAGGSGFRRARSVPMMLRSAGGPRTPVTRSVRQARRSQARERTGHPRAGRRHVARRRGDQRRRVGTGRAAGTRSTRARQRPARGAAAGVAGRATRDQ